MLPPKKKHEKNLVSLSAFDHHSNECNNYEIVRQLIKRSCNDNDVISLKSLIVLHHLIMSPETKNMCYLGAYFLNFSYHSSFNTTSRPVVIRKYGHYIDLLARNHTDSGLDLDTIRNHSMVDKFEKLSVAGVCKMIDSLERIIKMILNYDLPNMHCGNVLVYEVFRLVGMNSIVFMNCYTEAVVNVASRVTDDQVCHKAIQIISTYFDLATKVRLLYQYFKKHIFNQVDSVHDLHQLNEDQLQLMENIQLRQEEKPQTHPSPIPSPWLDTLDVPFDNFVQLETAASPVKDTPQWATFSSQTEEVNLFEFDPPFQNAPRSMPNSNSPQENEQSPSNIQKVPQSTLLGDFQQELQSLTLDAQNTTHSILQFSNPQEPPTPGLDFRNVFHSTLISDIEEFRPFRPDSAFNDAPQVEPSDKKLQELLASGMVFSVTNPFALPQNPTPVSWVTPNQFQPNNQQSSKNPANPFLFWDVFFSNVF